MSDILKHMFNLLIIFVAEYFYLVSVLGFILYFLQSKRALKKSILILGIPSFLLSYIVAKLLALFINDPRPFVVDHIKPLILHAPDNGFPSDHTLLTMTIASIIFVYNKKLGIGLFIIALLIGVARVLAHIHHPLDIIGAAIIAVGATSIVYFLEKAILNKHEQSTIKKKL